MTCLSSLDYICTKGFLETSTVSREKLYEVIDDVRTKRNVNFNYRAYYEFFVPLPFSSLPSFFPFSQEVKKKKRKKRLRIRER